ncbi:MAG: hypothetical protein IID46_15225, partial [Planctomycetes bacterium]|nr:hypothetical protein [Planctomycetota bacterium]
MKFLPIVLLLFAMPGCGSGPPGNEVESQKQAVAAIEKLSGKVKFDVRSPDYPVIEVFFNNTEITDKDLVHLKGFTKLQSLSLWQTK